MPSQNMKMGLISFGIVFGIGVVVISIVLIASSSSSGGRKGNSPSVNTVESGDFDEIQNHKWWFRPLKEQEVRSVIEKMVAANKGSFLFAKQNGTFFMQPPGWQHGLPEIVLVPDEMKGEVGGKRMYIHIQGSQRLTHLEAHNLLLAELNRVEFRDGPGRQISR